jgi:hypothetical protein
MASTAEAQMMRESVRPPTASMVLTFFSVSSDVASRALVHALDDEVLESAEEAAAGRSWRRSCDGQDDEDVRAFVDDGLYDLWNLWHA